MKSNGTLLSCLFPAPRLQIANGHGKASAAAADSQAAVTVLNDENVRRTEEVCGSKGRKRVRGKLKRGPLRWSVRTERPGA